LKKIQRGGVEMVKYDFRKLKGKIKEMFNTQNDFATAMEMTPTTLSSKLNNQFDFSSSEITKAVNLLHISSPEEAWTFFFTEKVENNSTN
jgi:hypothetical protein